MSEIGNIPSEAKEADIKTDTSEKNKLPETNGRKISRIKNLFNRRVAAAVGTAITAIGIGEAAVPTRSFAQELSENPTPIVQQKKEGTQIPVGIQNTQEILTAIAKGEKVPTAIVATSQEAQSAQTASEKKVVSEAEARQDLSKLIKVKGEDTQEEQNYKRGAVDKLAASNPGGVNDAIKFLKQISPNNLGEQGLILYANQFDYNPTVAGGKTIEESLGPKLEVLTKLVNDGNYRQEVGATVQQLRKEGYTRNFNLSYMTNGLLTTLQDPNQRVAFIQFSQDDRSSTFLTATGEKYTNFKQLPSETNTAFQAWKTESGTK